MRPDEESPEEFEHREMTALVAIGCFFAIVLMIVSVVAMGV